jgi:hypothetical protein
VESSVTPIIVWYCPRILIRVSCSRYIRPRTSCPWIRVCCLDPRLLGKAEDAPCDQTRSHQGYNLHFHGSLPFYTQVYVSVNKTATRRLAGFTRILWLTRGEHVSRFADAKTPIRLESVSEQCGALQSRCYQQQIVTVPGAIPMMVTVPRAIPIVVVAGAMPMVSCPRSLVGICRTSRVPSPQFANEFGQSAVRQAITHVIAEVPKSRSAWRQPRRAPTRHRE